MHKPENYTIKTEQLAFKLLSNQSELVKEILRRIYSQQYGLNEDFVYILLCYIRSFIIYFCLLYIVRAAAW